MRDRLTELGDHAEVVLITFTSRSRLERYQDVNDLPFTILVDEPRHSYRAYGLGRGSFWRVWGWRTLRRYAQLFRRRGFAGFGMPTEDTLQLGGDFVIGPDGALTWAYWGAGPDDRPSVDELIAAVGAATP